MEIHRIGYGSLITHEGEEVPMAHVLEVILEWDRENIRQAKGAVR